MSSNYKLAKAGEEVEAGWRVMPMMDLAKPEVQKEMESLFSGPEQVEELNSGKLVILVRGEAGPEKYRMVPADTPLEEGWSKLPLSAMAEPEIRNQVMALMNSADSVEGFNSGRLVVHVKGEGGPNQPEYGFVRRKSPSEEYSVPPGWRLLPLMQSQDPGVLIYLGMLFSRNESYVSEYPELLAITVKGEEEKKDSKYKLAKAGDPVEDGWEVMPMICMAKPDVEKQVQDLFTTLDNIEDLQSGKLVVHVKKGVLEDKDKFADLGKEIAGLGQVLEGLGMEGGQELFSGLGQGLGALMQGLGGLAQGMDSADVSGQKGSSTSLPLPTLPLQPLPLPSLPQPIFAPSLEKGKFSLKGKNTGLLVTNSPNSDDVTLAPRNGKPGQIWEWSGQMLQSGYGKVLEVDNTHTGGGAPLLAEKSNFCGVLEVDNTHTGGGAPVLAGKPNGGENQQLLLIHDKTEEDKKFFRIGGVATSRYKEADDLFVTFHEKGQNQWKVYLKTKEFASKDAYEGIFEKVHEEIFEKVHEELDSGVKFCGVKDSEDSNQSQFWWSDMNHHGKVPEGALKVGEDGGHDVYVARVEWEGKVAEWVGGKVHKGNCYVAHLEREIPVVDRVFSVLCVSPTARVEWVDRQDWRGGGYAVKIGDGKSVGRMEVKENMMVPGWVKDFVIHAPYDTKENTSTTYQLLKIT